MPPPRPPSLPYGDSLFVTSEPARTGRSRDRSREKYHTEEKNERSKSRGASPLQISETETIKKQLQEETEKAKLLSAQLEEMKEAQRRTESEIKEAQRRTENDKNGRGEAGNGYSRREEKTQRREQRDYSDKRESEQRRDKRYEESDNAQKRDQQDINNREKDERRTRETKKDEERDKPIKKNQREEEPKKDWCFHHWDELEAGRDGCQKSGCKFDHTNERQPCWGWDTGCQRGATCKFKHISENEWRKDHPNYPPRPNHQKENKRKTAPNEEGTQPNKRPDNRAKTACKFYNSSKGCSKRNECPFLHSDKSIAQESRHRRSAKDDEREDSPYDDTQNEREPANIIGDHERHGRKS